MRRVVLIGILLLAPPLVAATGKESEATPTGRRIMELVDERDDGDRVTQDMRMLLNRQEWQQPRSRPAVTARRSR